MPDVRFIEELDKLGIEITDDEADILKNEAKILKDNLKTAGDVFKLKAADLIKKLSARDVTSDQIIAVLLDDFDNDGEIFGGLKRSIMGAAEEYAGNVETQTAQQAWQDQGYDENETWIAVLVNTCKDCLARHGKTHKHSTWVAMGLPRSGWSVCKAHCQCQLLPASLVDGAEELRNPINRVKARITEVAKDKEVKSVRNYVNRKLGSINNTQDPIRKLYRKLLPGFKR